MKFGRSGAACSVSASQASRAHAVAANTVSDVLGHCRCSPLAIVKLNRCSLLWPIVTSSWAGASAHTRDRNPRRAALTRAAAPPACGLPPPPPCAWRSGPRGRPTASPNAVASSPRPRDRLPPTAARGEARWGKFSSLPPDDEPPHFISVRTCSTSRPARSNGTPTSTDPPLGSDRHSWRS